MLLILEQWIILHASKPAHMAGVAVALVSGGIDSPVAVARMLSKGWTIHPLHASQEPITGPEAEEKTILSIRKLISINEFSGKIAPELIVVPVAEQLSLFTDKRNHKEYFIHMKRLFNDIGCRLAEQVGATHLLTGENLGQVSSQTLGNMGCVESASNLPILRPLLGLDKVEIMDMARKLGTLSIGEGKEVCDALGPSKPATIADADWIEESERILGGINHLAKSAWKSRRKVNIKQLSAPSVGGS